MKRLLLDTNIYGLLTTDKDFHILHLKIEEQKSLKIYGLDLIRRELKQAPRILVGGVNLQASLLRAYSSFIVKEYTSEKAFEEIAKEYYCYYQKLGGSLPRDKLFNDFVIVACASIKNISIVVSEDNATMLNEMAKKAYETINRDKDIPFPDFVGYEKFKKMLLGTSFPDPFINSPDKFGVFLGLFNIFPFISFINFMFHRRLKDKLIYKSFVY